MKEGKIPVILDTDIGFDIDDTWALGLLLKCPELNVKLITTVSDDTTIKAKIVAKFLQGANRTDIPIGIGPKENSKRGLQYSWIKEYELPMYSGIIHERGIEALCDTVMESDEKVTVIAIGPLGNISRALKLNSNITKHAQFIGMQGSIRKGYIRNPLPHAEYNVVRNIQACRDAFHASWKKTITPLDTCGHIRLKRNNFQKISSSDKSIPRLIMENFRIWAKKTGQTSLIQEKQRTSILFDIVAIYLAFSEELINIENLRIDIDDKGYTKITEIGDNIRCATSWKNEKGFKDLIVNRLIGQ